MTLPTKYSLISRQWLHFLPAMVHAAVFWSMPMLNLKLHKGILTDTIDQLAPPLAMLGENIVIVEVLTSIVHVAIYLWLAARCLFAHRERIKIAFSYEEQISLGWLRNLLIGVIAIYLIWLLDEVFSDVLDLSEMFYSMLGGGMVLLIYTMSYLGLRQPVIFTGQTAPLVLADEGKHQKNETKYKTSSLSDDLSDQLVKELKELMVNQKPYLNSIL